MSRKFTPRPDRLTAAPRRPSCVTSVKVPSPLLWYRTFGPKLLHVDVGVAVVVVVADGTRPGRYPAPPDAGLPRDVGEAEPAQVAVEVSCGRGRRFRQDLRARQRPAVEEVDVGQSVAVVIQRGHARRKLLDHVFPAAGAVGVGESDPASRVTWRRRRLTLPRRPGKQANTIAETAGRQPICRPGQARPGSGRLFRADLRAFHCRVTAAA